MSLYYYFYFFKKYNGLHESIIASFSKIMTCYIIFSFRGAFIFDFFRSNNSKFSRRSLVKQCGCPCRVTGSIASLRSIIAAGLGFHRVGKWPHRRIRNSNFSNDAKRRVTIWVNFIVH